MSKMGVITKETAEVCFLYDPYIRANEKKYMKVMQNLGISNYGRVPSILDLIQNIVLKNGVANIKVIITELAVYEFISKNCFDKSMLLAYGVINLLNDLIKKEFRIPIIIYSEEEIPELVMNTIQHFKDIGYPYLGNVRDVIELENLLNNNLGLFNASAITEEKVYNPIMGGDRTPRVKIPL